MDVICLEWMIRMAALVSWWLEMGSSVHKYGLRDAARNQSSLFPKSIHRLTPRKVSISPLLALRVNVVLLV